MYENNLITATKSRMIVWFECEEGYLANFGSHWRISINKKNKTYSSICISDNAKSIVNNTCTDLLKVISE